MRLWLFIAALATFAAAPALAVDTLAKVKETGTFIWGGDQEGGGPYMYPDPAHPEHLIGFEVELADLLADELSKQLGRKVTATFSQGQWDMLPGLLRTGRIDLVLNGYELTPERTEVMDATDPYYIYRLQLMARADDASLSGMSDFLPGHKRRVGVLGGSSAETLVRGLPEGAANVVLYDGNTNAMLDVSKKKLDATVQDNVIAIFYGKEFPTLRMVGEPVAPGKYVMYVQKGDTAFKDAINTGMKALFANGKLRAVYERYGIWDKAQDELAQKAAPPVVEPPVVAAAPKASFFARHGMALVEAAGMTILLACTSMPLAILLGIFIALGRLYGPKALRRVLGLYVEVLRGTPLLLQLLVIFYLLPALGIILHPVAAGIIGLAVNYSAYEAEIYRAGLLAVPRGQLEAALTLGMSRRLALRQIIVPQAVRIVVPPVTNDFIALFKDTSVCSVITVVELSKRYNISVMNNPGEILPLAATAALLYLAMSYPLSMLSKRLEVQAHA